MKKPYQIEPLTEHSYTNSCPETVARRRLRRERIRYCLAFAAGVALTLASWAVFHGMFR